VRFPLERHAIFLTLAGSQAHGTAREGSDVDVRGVCVAPLPVRLSVFHTFEQYEGPLDPALAAAVLPRLMTHPTASLALDVKTECVVYDVAKLVALLSEANPSALELLFSDERDWLLVTPAWRRLHDARHRFLTKRVQQTFLGYAMAQLKKIKTHRSWLLEPPKSKPDFGLPTAGGTLSVDDQHRLEHSIADRLRSYGVDPIDMPKATRIAVEERLEALARDVLNAPLEELDSRLRAVATHALGLPGDVVTTLNAERKYRGAMKHWESYQSWKTQRNPARAELERRHGYDTKHAMHLVRLMRMGLEVLERGELVVRRPDAAELNAIRDGALSFDALVATATELEQRMRLAAERTTLPSDVDRELADALVVAIVTDT
jgi:hypothetical protein